MTRRVLVLGGTQFIGPAVVARLRELGAEVTLFHRGEHEDPAAAGVSHIHGDRDQLDAHLSALRKAAPDVVLDMAPMFERHATSAMRAFRGLARRIVAISSVDVYRAYGRLHGSEPGALEPVPLTEASPLRERLYPYRGEIGGRFDDYDKIPVERAVMSAPELPGTVLRLPAVHGERDPQHRLFMEVTRMDAGRPAILLAASARDWRWPRAYAGNVADAIALAVMDDRAAGRVYNVAEPRAMTQEEWVREAGRIAGWRGEVAVVADERLPEHLRLPLNFAQDMTVDSTRIRAELGYAERVTPEEGIRRAIAWERAHPPEKVDAARLDYAAEDAALASR